MQPETTVLSEASQKEEDETHTRAPVCGIQTDPNESVGEAEADSGTESRLVAAKEEG